MHLQPLFQNDIAIVDGTSQKLFEQGICLPSGTEMCNNDIERVSNIIKKACL
jgi:UDP-N-acetylbacillosamine transaminase